MSEAIPNFDTESEKVQELKDLTEKHFNSFMRNQVVGDMRDILEAMMDNEKTLVNLLQASVTQDATCIGNNFMDMRRKMFWELAEREAEREFYSEREMEK